VLRDHASALGEGGAVASAAAVFEAGGDESLSDAVATEFRTDAKHEEMEVLAGGNGAAVSKPVIEGFEQGHDGQELRIHGGHIQGGKRGEVICKTDAGKRGGAPGMSADGEADGKNGVNDGLQEGLHLNGGKAGGDGQRVGFAEDAGEERDDGSGAGRRGEGVIEIANGHGTANDSIGLRRQ